MKVTLKVTLSQDNGIRCKVEFHNFTLMLLVVKQHGVHLAIALRTNCNKITNCLTDSSRALLYS